MSCTEYSKQVWGLQQSSKCINELYSGFIRFKRLTAVRVHNRFGGMRDLANFCGDIRNGSWKQEREAGISIESGSGILCFYGVGMRP